MDATTLPTPVTVATPAMGSRAHLTVVADDPGPLLADAAELLARLETHWSRFRADSELSRLNAAGGAPCIVSEDTCLLVQRAVDAWWATGGRFDVTVHDAVRAAGYREDLEVVRSGEVVASPPLAAPGCAGIEVLAAARLVRLPEGVAVDPGGIGKGLAADLVAEATLARGARGACIEVGGDLRVVGTSPRSTGWRVVVDPADVGGRRIELALQSGAVATSTTGRRRWQTDQGERHHLLDPSTGRSASSGLATVLVVDGAAWRAEALATAALVAGAEDAPRLIADAGARGLIVTDAGGVIPAGSIAEVARWDR